MVNIDIRWHQRLNSYSKALSQFELFMEKDDSLNKLEIYGLFKVFDYTYDLSLNVLKEFLEFHGNGDIYSSKDVLREAFITGLIEDEEGWMDMFRDRGKTVQVYNEEIADEISGSILDNYYNLFFMFQKKMESIKKES